MFTLELCKVVAGIEEADRLRLRQMLADVPKLNLEAKVKFEVAK